MLRDAQRCNFTRNNQDHAMIKRMMGPEHGLKAVFGCIKAGEVKRKRAGKIKTAKLPTSLNELRTLNSVSERRPHNPRVRS